MNFKKLSGRICSAALAAAMVMSGLSVNAGAQMTSYSGNLPYGQKSAIFGKQCEEKLSGLSKSFYKQLYTFCKEVADGKRTRTNFELELSGNVSVSKLSDEWELAYHTFTYRYPELIFWISGCEIGSSYYSESKVESAEINLVPSKEYKGSKEKTVDAAKIKTAVNSIKKADKIIAKYKGKSDYEKIRGFCDEICALTEYNDAAAGTMEGGNPWQIPWVFDGDPKTNVVCEGYAKAFFYLCKKSGVECFITTGTMDGENHMWNVVILSGRSFLVDITNTDGFSDKLEVKVDMPYVIVLKGVADSDGNGCIMATPEKKMSWKEGNTLYTYSIESMRVDYRYDDITKSLYSKSLLSVSKNDYTPHSHKGEGEYKSNGSYHWRYCKKCGGFADAGAHEFNDKGVCTTCKAKKK